MSFLLPLEKGKAGFDATLNALDSTSLWTAIKSVKKKFMEIHVPKFEITSEFSDELKMVSFFTFYIVLLLA